MKHPTNLAQSHHPIKLWMPNQFGQSSGLCGQLNVYAHGPGQAMGAEIYNK